MTDREKLERKAKRLEAVAQLIAEQKAQAAIEKRRRAVEHADPKKYREMKQDVLNDIRRTEYRETLVMPDIKNVRSLSKEEYKKVRNELLRMNGQRHVGWK